MGRSKMLRFFLSVAFVLFSFIDMARAEPVAPEGRAELYRVDAQVFVGSQLVGRPTMLVHEGGDALIAVLDVDGYALRIQLRQPEALGGGAGSLALHSTLHRPDGRGGWFVAGRPLAVLAPGAEVSVNVTAAQMSDSYRVHFALARTGRTIELSEVQPIENCHAYRVVVLGQKAPENVSMQSSGEVGGEEGSSCCKSGPVTCCGSAGSCCYDYNLPDRPGCCVP